VKRKKRQRGGAGYPVRGGECGKGDGARGQGGRAEQSAGWQLSSVSGESQSHATSFCFCFCRRDIYIYTECVCVCIGGGGLRGECERGGGGGEARTNAKNGRRHLLRSARWHPVLLLLLSLLLGILLPAIQHTHTHTLTLAPTLTRGHMATHKHMRLREPAVLSV